jgi:hypothetical protein
MESRTQFQFSFKKVVGSKKNQTQVWFNLYYPKSKLKLMVQTHQTLYLSTFVQNKIFNEIDMH